MARRFPIYSGAGVSPDETPTPDNSGGSVSISTRFSARGVTRSGLVAVLLLALVAPLWAQSGGNTPRPDPAPTSRPPLPSPPQLPAESYLLQDFTSGRVLVSHNPDMRVEPASITKLMTSYVVFSELEEGNIALDDQVTVSEKAWRTEGSRMFIEPDTAVSVEDLIKGMVIQSGNDASVALAEHVAGSEEAFADLMNHYAETLGMQATHYTNATGLPHAEHYTTARDVARLSTALIGDFPTYYAWYSDKEFTYNGIRQHNRNTLLWRDPAVDGLKTGHTESAGYCLASSAEQDGMRLISVVMGSASEASRASESQSLLNYGFRFFETVPVYAAGEALTDARVWRGKTDEVSLGLSEAMILTLPRDRYDDLEAEVELQPELSAPLDEGDVVGELRVRLDGEVLATRPLVTLAAVERAGFLSRSADGFKLWIDDLFGDDEEAAAESDSADVAAAVEES